MQKKNKQIQRNIRDVIKENEDAMARTIRLAEECNDIGDSTLAKLACDREKLRNVDKDLDFINDSLKRAEYHLTSLEVTAFLSAACFCSLFLLR